MRGTAETSAEVKNASSTSESPECFHLRPTVEKTYGYTHAVRIGNDLKISGAVSLDSAGGPTAVCDLDQQMKNAYADLEKVLSHYGYTVDDVRAENVFTTNMAKSLEVSAYRTSPYKMPFPTGAWLEVKGLALPECQIGIKLEARKAKRQRPRPASR